jgi:hypothetical protein
MFQLVGTMFLGMLILSSTQTPTQSALATDPKGWIDLLGDKSLKD